MSNPPVPGRTSPERIMELLAESYYLGDDFFDNTHVGSLLEPLMLVEIEAELRDVFDINDELDLQLTDTCRTIAEKINKKLDEQSK